LSAGTFCIAGDVTPARITCFLSILDGDLTTHHFLMGVEFSFKPPPITQERIVVARYIDRWITV